MKETDITKSLNKMLADLHVLNVKLHNYHWNVSGMQFPMVHKTTESYYNFLFEQFDDIAERVLQLGSKPIATVKAYLERSTIKEDEGTKFEAVYVFESIVSDFSELLAEAKKALGCAENAGDTGTQDLLSGLIAWLEKELWLLKSTLGQ